MSVHGASGPQENQTLEAMLKASKAEAKELEIAQDTSEDAFANKVQEAVNPHGHKLKKKRKSMKERHGKVQKAESGIDRDKSDKTEMLKDTANKFEARNPELKSKMLMLLREYIKPDDDAETILDKLAEFYEDVSLGDEALEFLNETTEGELNQEIQKARSQYGERFGREIRAGRNIAKEAREFSEEGIGSATGLRDLYRDITGNPRDSNALFDELSDQFDYEKLQKVAKFLFHSLGADMKAKGPSIPRGLLHRLLSETRSLQAIMGVYRFFKGRMGLVGKLFSKYEMQQPKGLTFELLAKQFMKIAKDRYPSSDKAIRVAGECKIDDDLASKMIVLSQMRDAVKEVSMNQIFQGVKQRDTLLTSIIEALEEIEDELEEEEWMDEDDDWGDEDLEDGFSESSID